jgi:hypothetical protein
MAEDILKCPNCAKPMRLARVIPAVAGHPELCSYECLSCREVTTVEVAPSKARQ